LLPLHGTTTLLVFILESLKDPSSTGPFTTLGKCNIHCLDNYVHGIHKPDRLTFGKTTN